MKFHVLAVDYDGTLADNGFVDSVTVDALVRLRQSGRRIVLVTGRLLAPLLAAFPEVAVCDRVVAENGALLFNPDTREERPLIDPPPREFVEELRKRGVEVGEVGHVIVATHVPFETLALEVIRDMGLELQIVFNKGAVMILPTGVNKASGLRCALKELGLSRHNTVGIGDAENDLAFLTLCEASVAVENALDAVKKQADITLSSTASRGVAEVVEQLIDGDLANVHLPKRGFLLGTDLDDNEVWIPMYGTRMLVTGDSAGGKSKLAVTILEQLIDAEYQTCVIDPEGDYQSVERAIVLGTAEQTPTSEEVMHVIRQPDSSCVVSLFATKAVDQPAVFRRLFHALQEHRVSTGRPHWNIIDEAHYPISPVREQVEDLHLEEWRSVMYVTAFTDRMPQSVVKEIDLFVAIADDPLRYLIEYSKLIGVEPPELPPPEEGRGHRAVGWWRKQGQPFWFQRPPSRGEHQRHRHQYFDGEMDKPHQFYFRGEDEKLNLAAGNLRTFMKLAEGVDDETWLYHLRRGDYSDWFRHAIQDSELAATAEKLQRDKEITAQESRQQINEMIQKLYVKEL